jgi:hypothetical protein
MKTCSNCKEELPPENFGKHKRTWDGLQAYCKPCKTVVQRRYARPSDKTNTKNRDLMRLYGITLAEFNEMVARQGGTCSISTCDRPATHVDHNHDTGQVRGVLCNQHNAALGLAGDCPVHLRAMAQYLEDTSHYG